MDGPVIEPGPMWRDDVGLTVLTMFNLLKPTGYVMNHQFNIQQLYAMPTLYLCVLLQHKLIGFYNRDEKCLQRGTDWVFK